MKYNIWVWGYYFRDINANNIFEAKRKACDEYKLITGIPTDIYDNHVVDADLCGKQMDEMDEDRKRSITEKDLIRKELSLL